MNLTRKSFIKKGITAAAALALAPLFAMGKHHVQRKIKVGVIGCGRASDFYLPTLSASRDVQLVCVCDIRYERAQQQALKYQVPHHYPHIDKMLQGEPFDLMVNLTDMQEHGRLNRLAIEGGKHIWSEKPLANTYREGQELLDLARSKDLRIWAAPMVVTSPQFAFMSNAIQEGKLGKISAAHSYYGHLGADWASFFYEKNGGSLPDLGIYNLTTITGLLGPAKSVIAMTGIVTGVRKITGKGDINVEAEDNAMVTMDHGNGILSHIQCGFNYFDPGIHDSKTLQNSTVSIWGTKGNMKLIGNDWAPAGVDIITGPQGKKQRLVTDRGSYKWQQGASIIAEALVTGKEPYNTIEHTLHVLEIIEAARESAAIGKRFTLRSTFRWPVI